MSSYIEDTLVQQKTADYLEEQLNWEPAYAYTRKNVGTESLLGQTGTDS